jgi:general secretion pathway protein D
VGETRPFQTSTTITSDRELQNFEYRDVGVTLKITPHITKDRMVRLQIFHEIQKLDELAETGIVTPTTLKRSIETTVIVKDKSTVVIGGLIDDAISNVTNKIPCLGDIPLAGWLFKTLSKNREKTNLFIFLTPHVISSPEEADAIYNKKKDQAPVIIEGGEIKLYE